VNEFSLGAVAFVTDLLGGELGFGRLRVLESSFKQAEYFLF
jgi:hypothetical protein